MLLTTARVRGRRLASALAGSWRPVESAPRVSVDRSLADLMLRHGCGGLGFRVALKEGSQVESLGRLHDVFRWTALSARRHELNLACVARLLGRTGIDAIIAKGWAVARQYPGPGLRPYGDIDVYVPGEDGAWAWSTLAAEPGIPVDLHRGYADLDDRDPAELRRRSVMVDVEGTTVRLFGPEDHLRLLCVHAARHGALRALWLCDIGLLLECLPATFDVPYFSFGDPHRTEIAFRVLGLAHALLDARLDRLGVDHERVRPPAWMVDAVLGEWGRGRTAHGARRPWRTERIRPWRWPQAALLRWPNALEAVHETRMPRSRGGAFLVQLAACVRRIKRHARTIE